MRRVGLKPAMLACPALEQFDVAAPKGHHVMHHVAQGYEYLLTLRLKHNVEEFVIEVPADIQCDERLVAPHALHCCGGPVHRHLVVDLPAVCKVDDALGDVPGQVCLGRTSECPVCGIAPAVVAKAAAHGASRS